MQWSDNAVLLSIHKYGENSALVRLFAQTQGVHAGICRGMHGKKNRGVLQVGNVVNAHWQARLSEQLGTFRFELMDAVAAFAMQDAAKLAAMSSACALMDMALPERHLYERLYAEFTHFLQVLKTAEAFGQTYVQLELALLAQSGFGLDLTRCAATGSVQDLIYVSPRSGCAVSREAGEPYKDKLLPLPSFLLAGHQHLRRNDPAQEILAGMQLTGYFLEHWLLAPHGRKLPAARGRLLEQIQHGMIKEI